MAEIVRNSCPVCGAQCLPQEAACWQCGTPFRAQPAADSEASAPAPTAAALIRFDSDTDADGEAATADTEPVPERVAARVGAVTIAAGPVVPVMRLTFCKECGYQNQEDAEECARCKRPLETVAAGSVGDVTPLPRDWSFDVLGAAWLLLGFAAVYCGQFLVKADPAHPGATWADYFWTGIVVCAPGVLVHLRHYFCKLLFWVMTLGSALVWAVIGFIWLFVGLRVTENGEVGLVWLAVLSGLSAVSYVTVRANDAFDYGL